MWTILCSSFLNKIVIMHAYIYIYIYIYIGLLLKKITDDISLFTAITFIFNPRPEYSLKMLYRVLPFRYYIASHCTIQFYGVGLFWRNRCAVRVMIISSGCLFLTIWPLVTEILHICPRPYTSGVHTLWNCNTCPTCLLLSNDYSCWEKCLGT